MRKWASFLLFLAISTAVHVLLLVDVPFFRSKRKAAKKSDAAVVQLVQLSREVQDLKRLLEKQEPAKPLPPRPKPVRRIYEENLPVAKPEPTPPKPDPPKPDREKPEPKPQPKNPPPEQTPPTKAKTKPKPIATLKEYRAYTARSVREEDIRGHKVPHIRFEKRHSDEALFAIMKFYGMKLIAYDRQKRTFFVEIDSLNPLRCRKSTDFSVFKNYSNRTIFWDHSDFPKVAQQVAEQFAISRERLELATFLPFETADYLAWKELTTCRRAGFDPEKIEACHASFKKTTFGAWIVTIWELATNDGRRVRVRDFEEDEIAGRNS